MSKLMHLIFAKCELGNGKWNTYCGHERHNATTDLAKVTCVPCRRKAERA